MPYLGIMAEFRDNIRNNARVINATDILKECDRLRDDVLPNVGVRLEDREGKDFQYKFIRNALKIKSMLPYKIYFHSMS